MSCTSSEKSGTQFSLTLELEVDDGQCDDEGVEHLMPQGVQHLMPGGGAGAGPEQGMMRTGKKNQQQQKNQERGSRHMTDETGTRHKTDETPQTKETKDKYPG